MSAEDNLNDKLDALLSEMTTTPPTYFLPLSARVPLNDQLAAQGVPLDDRYVTGEIDGETHRFFVGTADPEWVERQRRRFDAFR